MTEPLKARHYMNIGLVTLKPNHNIYDAMRVFLTHNISGAPVVDQTGIVVGILTEKNCFRASLKCWGRGKKGGQVREYMTRGIKSIDADDDIEEVIEVFRTSNYRRFPVLEGEELVGLISRRDVLRALNSKLDDRD